MKVIIVATVLSLFGATLPSHAQAAVTRYDLNIPREPLDGALNEFAQQTGLQVARFSDVAKGAAKVGPVVGHLTTKEALGALLAGSGLDYRMLSHRTIAIVQAGDRSASTAPSGSPEVTPQKNNQEAQGSSSGVFRVAQAAQAQSASAAAVETTSSSSVLQEVIVTAQKREERAFDVPISLAVLTANDIQANHITSLSDVQYYVPGLWIQNNGAQRRINIDGISNTYGSGSLVGTYLDDADTTPDGFAGNYGYGQLDIRTYDMSRVEVLRGPQGTLYGEGSMGGAIHLVTNKPNLNRFELGSDVAVELTQDGAPSQRIDMMLNTPLVNDTLALRIAGEFEHQGGWIDEPAANAQNINDQNLVDVRAQALWKPTDHFQLNLLQIEHRNEFGLDLGEDRSGNYTQLLGQTTLPHGTQSYDLSNAKLAYDFSGAQLISSTTYFHNSTNNIDWGLLIPVSGTVYENYNTAYPNTEENLSEELRLARTGNGPWQWTIGYFYKHFTDAATELGYFNTAVPPGTPLSTISPQPPYNVGDQDKASAGFADTSYRLFDRLTIGAGGRYYTDNVHYSVTGSPFQSRTFSSTDPRVYIRYSATDDINVYASAAKGFTSGGFNAYGQPAYQPESVWTYDLGTKMRLLHGALSIESDVYRSIFSNFDIAGLTAENPVSIIRNGGTTRIEGINVDVAWRPLEQWTFGLKGDYVDAKFVTINVLNAAYDVGDPVPNVPEYLVTGSVQRDFQWLNKPASARIEYSQLGPATYLDRPLEEFGVSPVLHLLNLNIGMQWTDNLRLSVYAQNLLNDRGYLDPLGFQNVAPRERPRTVGIEFSTTLD